MLACGNSNSVPFLNDGGKAQNAPPKKPKPNAKQTAADPSAFATNCVSGTQKITLEATNLGLVNFINQLPKPLSIPCLLSALPRPLALNASSSTRSIQPAAGSAAPRVFVNFGNLVIAVSAQGAGTSSIELGELTGDGMAFTGNIDFPVNGQLNEASLYTSTQANNGGNACGSCHGAIQSVVTNGVTRYKMAAFQPDPTTNVSLSSLQIIANNCRSSASPTNNCSLLQEFFDETGTNFSAFSFPADVGFFK